MNINLQILNSYFKLSNFIKTGANSKIRLKAYYL